MPYCSSCGSELRGDTKFCASCGQPVAQAAAAATEGAAATPAPPAYSAPPAPPVLPVTPVAGHASAPPPPPYPGPRRRSFTWAWIGGAAAVVVIAIVCVLVFVVFKGGDDKEAAAVATTVSAVVTSVTQPGGLAGTTSTLPSTTTETAPVSTTATAVPSNDDVAAVKAVVMQLFTAMENQDADLLFKLMDPSVLAALPEGEARDAALAAVKAELATLGKMKFSGIEMTVEITSPTTATATLTGGSMSLTDATGTTTEDIKDSSTPGTMDLTKQDGQWYISSSFFQ